MNVTILVNFTAVLSFLALIGNRDIVKISASPFVQSLVLKFDAAAIDWIPLVRSMTFESPEQPRCFVCDAVRMNRFHSRVYGRLLAHIRRCVRSSRFAYS